MVDNYMWIETISGLGIGTILGALLGIVLQFFLSERSKRKTIYFQERKEAFIGLLESYRNCANSPSDLRPRHDFAYWDIRCQLISSQQVNNDIKRLKDSNPKVSERDIAEKILINSMRQDLNEYM